MVTFESIPSDEPLHEVIKAAFDADLPVSGGWGYSRSLSTIIEELQDNTSIVQIEHMLASMRAYIEMHLTLSPQERYGSINLNEKERETIKINGKTFHKVLYEISAMKETLYTQFIDEYKEGYGKDDFDMEAHFKRRKEATLIRLEAYWFDVTPVV